MTSFGLGRLESTVNYKINYEELIEFNQLKKVFEFKNSGVLHQLL